jgi:membrane carboxypeptidase/penicillin-binding protein
VGVISPERAADASAEPIAVVAPIEARGEAPFFIAAVRRELRDRFGDTAESAGYRVHTALEPDLQRSAQLALREHLAAIERGELGTFRGPKCAEPPIEDPAACLQGMFVALDNRTGDILALVGGRDFAISQFDRTMQARRQAGSAFKPFLFATALSQGVPITTPLLGPGAADYEGGYVPADHVVLTDVPMDLREALRLSSNRAAVVLGEQVGVANVIHTARAMGLTTPIQDYPSTLLGAADVIPLEMVAAFTAFANAGTVVTPRLIQRVEDGNGQLLWEAPLQQRTALSPEVAFLTTDLMEDVVDTGTGARVRSSLPAHIPAAGKTGTTNEAADAWFVGFTPDVTAGVWVGFDQPKRITVGGGGGSLAAPIWGKVMAEFYSSRPAPAPWIAPYDVISRQIDRETGQLATADCPEEQVVTEWFLYGTEPREYCRIHETGVDGWFRRNIRGLGNIFRGEDRNRRRN